jgi:hypothetical protein
MTAVYKFNHTLHFARTEFMRLTTFDGQLTVLSNEAIPA